MEKAKKTNICTERTSEVGIGPQKKGPFNLVFGVREAKPHLKTKKPQKKLH